MSSYSFIIFNVGHGPEATSFWTFSMLSVFLASLRTTTFYVHKIEKTIWKHKYGTWFHHPTHLLTLGMSQWQFPPLSLKQNLMPTFPSMPSYCNTPDLHRLIRSHIRAHSQIQTGCQGVLLYIKGHSTFCIQYWYTVSRSVCSDVNPISFFFFFGHNLSRTAWYTTDWLVKNSNYFGHLWHSIVVRVVCW